MAATSMAAGLVAGASRGAVDSIDLDEPVALPERPGWPRMAVVPARDQQLLMRPGRNLRVPSGGTNTGAARPDFDSPLVVI
jgi:hypothetical protein